MITKEQLDQLEDQTGTYCMASQKISFLINNRQEELEGILRAYQGMNDASAQVLRHYFLNGGTVE